MNQVAKPIANKILSIEYFYIPVHTGELKIKEQISIKFSIISSGSSSSKKPGWL